MFFSKKKQPPSAQSTQTPPQTGGATEVTEATEGGAGGVNVSPATTDENNENKNSVATFAAGCFWGVQASFDALEGVIETEVGYTGGELDHPSYEDVCEGGTGHAEAVRVAYDPQQVSYRKLLSHFLSIHDPTQFNRQGPDVGHQYRSAIFYSTDAQRELAQGIIELEKKSKRSKRPIVTEVVAASTWWPAEKYHQHYLASRRRVGGGMLGLRR